MSSTKFWKVWLTPNLLTRDVDNDYIAEVSTSKQTLRNEDIAERIVNEGSEIKYDTLLSIINQHDRIIRGAVCDGYSVLTGVAQFSPRVTGNWLGKSANFDPSTNKLTLDMVLSKEMRDALATVGVEVLGVKEGGGAGIGLVTNTLDGNTDGYITPGEDILIEGTKIKIAGDEEMCGVFFVLRGAETETVRKVDRRLTQNNPSSIIARVPADLEPGEYILRIVTQFSNSAVLLKEPRTLEYEQPLFVS